MLAALAGAYAESGDFDKAVKYQKQALDDESAVKTAGGKSRASGSNFTSRRSHTAASRSAMVG